MTPAIAAFAAADFRRTRASPDVWADAAGPVEGLHDDVTEAIVAEVFAEAPAAGLALTGAAGAGKSHVLAELRRRVIDGGGGFVRIDLFGVADFRRAAALGFVDSLSRRTKRGSTQAGAVLLAALKALSADPAALKAAAGARPQLARVNAVELMLAMLAAREPDETARRQDVVRALALLDSADAPTRRAAAQWLQGHDDARASGLQHGPPAPAEVVRGLMWIMAIAGPTLIAVDGIDALFGEARAGGETGRHAGAMLQAVGEGLVELAITQPRAVTLVSCLDSTWDGLKTGALAQFRETPLGPVGNADVVGRLVAGRLAPAYAGAHLAPPYPAYPFTPAAIESAIGLSPREILLRCRDHQDACVADGELYECDSLAEPSRGEAPALADSECEALDEAFSKGLGQPTAAGDEAGVVAWLVAACELYLRQFRLPPSISGEVIADATSPNPALHARLALIQEDGRQLSFGFRALAEIEAAPFRAQLQAAMAGAGLGAGRTGRKLVILRDGPTPADEATEALVRTFSDAGGQFVTPTRDDFAVVAALRQIERRRGFDAWLRQRKPLMDTTLFHAAGLALPALLEPPPTPQEPRKLPPPILSGAAPTLQAAGSPPSVGALAALATRERPAPAEIFIGRSAQLGEIVGPVALPAALLPRHIGVFAGAAGGKNVMLCRLVEEAALIGAPALVLDVHNEFARLGESWPSRPTDFTDDDARKAKLYFERVEVIVWTPGISGGRPISLPALPDFAALGRDSDAESREERERAIEMTLATFEPFLPNRGAKAIRMRGALADALRAFARAGGGAIDELLRLLHDLPSTASRNPEAPALAREIAGELAAAIVANPILGSKGPPLDLSQLFVGETRKTRVSVINLLGLPDDAARAAFANQLQNALFFSIKRHTGPALFVLDEAHIYAPAKEAAPAKRGALAFFKQASKYGLGIVAAAEAPQALDPAIASQCLTQIYGRARSPESLAAIAAMMVARGGAEDLGRLRTGELYFVTEGYARPIRIRTPLSLSRRTAIPPTTAEVAAIARRRP